MCVCVGCATFFGVWERRQGAWWAWWTRRPGVRCLPPGRCLRVFPRVDGTPVCISSFVLSSSLRSVSASLLLALFSPVPFRPILPPWCSNRFLVCPLRTNALFGTSPLSSPSHTRPTAVLGAPPLPFASPTRFRCLWSRPPPTQSHKNQPNRTPCPPLPPPPTSPAALNYNHHHDPKRPYTPGASIFCGRRPSASPRLASLARRRRRPCRAPSSSCASCSRTSIR